MRLVYQSFEFVVRAEAAVYLIIIRDGIAVIRAVGHVVLLGGIEPDGRHAQVGDVVQVVGYTLQVAAVSGILFVAIYLVFQHTGHYIVSRVAVGKAVGHDEVEHILGGEALDIFTTARALLQGVGDGSNLFALFQDDVKCLGGGFGEIYIQ